jgi:hypothetical protein
MSLNRKQIGDQNASTLSTWFEANEARLAAEFCYPDGVLKQSAIAKAAGVSKQIFTSNPVAKALLTKYGKPSTGIIRELESYGAADELMRKKDATISQLTDKVQKREIELLRLRKEVAALRQREAARQIMLETGKHVKQFQPESNGIA